MIPLIGVFLYSEAQGTTLSNNTLTTPENVFTHTSGLSCYSALVLNRLHSNGRWYFPNGTQISPLLGAVMFIAHRISRVELLINQNSQFTSEHEGVYTCRIPDETNTIQTLYAGIYTMSSYQNLGKPCYMPKAHSSEWICMCLYM